MTEQQNDAMAQLTSLTTQLAHNLKLQNPDGLIDVLLNTVFRNASVEQVATLLIVANQYNLNPWTKEIYAFPDRNNGIVPTVGVDGWARIINSHPQFDGMDFEQDAESCTCIIYRKDRNHPVKVTEYLSECRRKTTPWETAPKRMLRHKAMIQCARLAFSLAGIKDEDEAAKIIENQKTEVPSANNNVIEGECVAVLTDEEAARRCELIEWLTEAAHGGITAMGTAWTQLPQADKDLITILEKNRIYHEIAKPLGE